MLTKGYIFVSRFICVIKVRHTEGSGVWFWGLTHTVSLPAALHGFSLIGLLHWPGQAAGHPGSWSQQGDVGGAANSPAFSCLLGSKSRNPWRRPYRCRRTPWKGPPGSECACLFSRWKSCPRIRREERPTQVRRVLRGPREV